MKVSINSSIASLVVDLPEEQIMSLVRTALNQAFENAPPKIPTPKVASNYEVTPDPVHTETDSSAEQEEPIREYKGFLYIQCEKCGTLKAFMPKNPISKHRCECGHDTVLRDMVEMHVDCKCDKHFKYMTNVTDTFISIDCLSCGAPVDLEYNVNNRKYQTIK